MTHRGVVTFQVDCILLRIFHFGSSNDHTL